jgi:hypothetical protein
VYDETEGMVNGEGGFTVSVKELRAVQQRGGGGFLSSRRLLEACTRQ